jgi:hypothetical protein
MSRTFQPLARLSKSSETRVTSMMDLALLVTKVGFDPLLRINRFFKPIHFSRISPLLCTSIIGILLSAANAVHSSMSLVT